MEDEDACKLGIVDKFISYFGVMKPSGIALVVDSIMRLGRRKTNQQATLDSQSSLDPQHYIL